MDKILIENYEVKACHGVNPEEKINPQRFLISAEIECDFSLAGKNDDINQTTSYSAVCKMIKSFLSENCFDLLETIATHLAYKILHTFTLAKGVNIVVKKPDAPMKGVFDYVGVATYKKWHTVYVALGSSMGDKNAYFDGAIAMLKNDENIRFDIESSRIQNDAYGGVASGVFLNSVARIETLYSPFELLDVLHNIENAFGRERSQHWGDRTLDLDIIFYDDEIVSDEQLVIPHIDMKNRIFVLKPLNEIAPYYLHPIYGKRVCEMYDELISK